MQWQGPTAEILGWKCVTYGCFSLQESQGYVHGNAGISEYCCGLSIGRHVAADICNVKNQGQKDGGCCSISIPRPALQPCTDCRDPGADGAKILAEEYCSCWEEAEKHNCCSGTFTRAMKTPVSLAGLNRTDCNRSACPQMLIEYCKETCGQ